LNNNRIVIVDDNRGFGETVQEFLNLRGYKTELITDVTVARESLTQNPPSLAIIDVRLINSDDKTDQSGLSLARQLDTRLPKIILSEFRDDTIIRDALNTLGGKAIAVDFVQKDSGLETLLTSVRLALTQMPPTFEKNVLTEFQADGRYELRKQLNNLGASNSVRQFQKAKAKTVEMLEPLQEAARQKARKLHHAAILTKILGLSNFVIALVMFFFDLIEVSKITTFLGLVAQGINVYLDNRERWNTDRAEKVWKEIQQTKHVAILLQLCEAIEDPQHRDDYRKKILDQILSRESD